MFGGKKAEEPPVHTKYALRVKQPAVRNFIKVLKIDLERLRQHKANIDKVPA